MEHHLRLERLLEFVSTKYFDRAWSGFGFTDDDRRRLENEIAARPLAYPLMQGTGGLRKIRFARRKGKSGGVRVCFAFFVTHDVILLYTVFAKSDAENLTAQAKAIAKKALQAFVAEMEQRSI